VKWRGGMKTRCFNCHKPAALHRKLCKSCAQVRGVFDREKARQEAVALTALSRRNWCKTGAM
jgi:sulfur relay (sulfurtransferase) complex TusBCD TusD component (DsrE family)